MIREILLELAKRKISHIQCSLIFSKFYINSCCYYLTICRIWQIIDLYIYPIDSRYIALVCPTSGTSKSIFLCLMNSFVMLIYVFLHCSMHCMDLDAGMGTTAVDIDKWRLPGHCQRAHPDRRHIGARICQLWL